MEAGAAGPIPEPADGHQERLGRRAAAGSIWVAVGYGGGQVVRFASNVVLTRLLFPRAFGLMLLLNVVVQGLQMFSDLGIGTSIIQNDRSDRGFLDTAWTVQVARGLLLWGATIVLAWPAAALYGENELLWMLPVAGLGALLDGLTSTALHVANRGLRMARLQIFDLVSQITASAVMIGLAWATRSAWALLIGMLAGTATRVAASHLLLPGPRNRLRWERDAASGLLHFGKWVFVSSIVTFLAQQGDRLVFGKMLPMSRLGVYNIALALCDAPSSLISTIAFRVFFPMFSELRRTTSSVDSAYQKVSSALAFIGGAGALTLIVTGPLVTSWLYDSRYAEASWIIRVLALGIWGTCLVHFTAAVVLAGGRIKWLAAANAARLVWLAFSVPISFRLWGFDVALVLLVFADVPRYVVLGLACRRDGVHVFLGDALRTLALAGAAVAGIGAAALGTGRLLPVLLAFGASQLVWIACNVGAARWYLEKAAAALAARRARLSA